MIALPVYMSWGTFLFLRGGIGGYAVAARIQPRVGVAAVVPIVVAPVSLPVSI